jgi:hypothetical protein
MLVDLDYVIAVKKRLRQINAEDMDNIEWIKDGKPVEFDKKDLAEFKFMGLNNTDLITVFGFTPK